MAFQASTSSRNEAFAALFSGWAKLDSMEQRRITTLRRGLMVRGGLRVYW
jgi:hypothetical protein